MHPIAERERKFIEEETNTKTIIGELGTVVTMEKNITIEKI